LGIAYGHTLSDRPVKTPCVNGDSFGTLQRYGTRSDGYKIAWTTPSNLLVIRLFAQEAESIVTSMEISSAALYLAGFTLAHSLWSVSDTKPTELLVPLMIVEKDGERTLQRFEAATQVEAIEAGKAASEKLIGQVDGWAFAREGTTRIVGTSDVPKDVISVSLWIKGMEKPIVVVARFERATASHGFQVIGSPVISIDGKQLADETAKPLVEDIIQGVLSHKEVTKLWEVWKKRNRNEDENG
jgi:hypothetical protein